MGTHTHQFVETYQGLVGFGMDRETDESTLCYYLQKFSDDRVMANLLKRMSDQDMQTLFDLISSMLCKHLNETEYHSLFLKEENSHQ